MWERPSSVHPGVRYEKFGGEEPEHIDAVSSFLYTPSPSSTSPCTLPYTPAPSYTPLHPPVPPPAPSPTPLHPPLHPCTLLYTPAPSPTPLHPPLHPCTLPYTPAPFSTPLHPPLHPCTLPYTPAPFSTPLNPPLHPCTLPYTPAPFSTPLHPSLHPCTLPYTPVPSPTPLHPPIHPCTLPYTPAPSPTPLHPPIHPCTLLYLPLHPPLHPCTLLYTPAPSYTPLHPPLHPCTLPYTPAPFSTPLHPPLHPCTLPYTPAPSYTPLHPPLHPCTLPYTPAPSYTPLHPPVPPPAPSPTPLHPSLHPCTLLYTPAPSPTPLHPPLHPCTLLMAHNKTELPTKDSCLKGRAEKMVVPEKHAANGNPTVEPFPEGMEMIMFGMGCFWGAERRFWNTKGVFSTQVGYAGGLTPHPTYKEVCSGLTGHTEVVRVVFSPQQVTLQQLLKVFWESHDPTQDRLYSRLGPSRTCSSVHSASECSRQSCRKRACVLLTLLRRESSATVCSHSFHPLNQLARTPTWSRNIMVRGTGARGGEREGVVALTKGGKLGPRRWAWVTDRSRDAGAELGDDYNTALWSRACGSSGSGRACVSWFQSSVLAASSFWGQQCLAHEG
ncbi:hypothetical protein ACEWY4_004976 [Coilia grayii]|uniref:peptide-methionine (S)-S-oxide reductase n=1 Tax=Coilia grayii TaxID=363190 RepID=A0ABD1KHI9_9TELE